MRKKKVKEETEHKKYVGGFKIGREQKKRVSPQM